MRRGSSSSREGVEEGVEVEVQETASGARQLARQRSS